jgi:hypothetical protein
MAGGVSIIASIIFWRYVKYSKYMKSFIISGMLYLLCVLGIVLTKNQLFIYAFMPLIVLLYISMDIPRSVFTMNILHSVKEYKKYIWEYILFTELAIIIGRALVFVMILCLWNLTTLSLTYIFGSMWLAILLSMLLFYTLTTNLH